MIVLVYPTDARPLEHALTFAETLAAVRPAWGVLALVPAGEQVRRVPRVTLVPAPICIARQGEPGRPVAYDATWHDVLLRQLGIDVVWCEQIAIGGHLKHAGDAVYSANGRPLIVAAHVIDPELLDEHRTLGALFGALQADYNIWCSDREQAQWFVRCATWANDAALDVLSVGDVLPLPTGADPAADRHLVEPIAQRLERLNQWSFDGITPADALDLVRRQLLAQSGCTSREFFGHVARKEVNGRVPFSNQSMPITRLIRVVRHLGGRVAMVNGVQRVYAPGAAPR